MRLSAPTSTVGACIWASVTPRYRDVIEKQRRLAEEHVEEIWAEQEALNAARTGPTLRRYRSAGSTCQA